MIKRIVLAAHLKVGLFDMTLISKTRGIYLVGHELHRGSYLGGMKLYQVINDIETHLIPKVSQIRLFGSVFYIHSMDRSLTIYDDGQFQRFYHNTTL